MFYLPLSVVTELDVVAVRPSHQSHPLDLLQRKRLDAPRADQSYPSDTEAIGEGQMSSVGIELPAGDFVLDRAIVVLEARVAFLAWHLRATVA